ncbi:MAG: NAD(P)/FAD-dependent oxidoreductase [Myxococcota bacterium]
MAAPVVIAGAGPVGLTTALTLAQRGIEVRVLEQRPGAVQDPRATTVQPPVLEVLDDLGVLHELLGRGTRVDRIQYWDLPQRSLLADLDLGLLAADTRHPFRLHVPQAEVVDVLVGALTAVQPDALHYGRKVVGFVDRGSDIAVDADTGGVRTQLEGAFLVSAEGTRSGVREELGIGMDVAHTPVAFVSARAELSLVDALQQHLGPVAPQVAGVAYVLHDDGWATVMTMTDHVRVLLPATTDDPQSSLSRETMAAQAEAILGTGWGVEIESLALYHVWQRVAKAYRAGRVLLAGDAAHSAWPIGGTSMNFGMLDGWHLARAIADGSEVAIDAYAENRRDEASRMLLSGADSLLHVVDPWGMWERNVRRRLLQAVSSDPVEARRHLQQLSLLPVSNPA